MTGLGRIVRLRPGRRPSLGERRRRSPRELLATLGRAALWLTVAVVLLRGLASTFSNPQQAARAGAARGVQAAVWPDDAARAFAVEFTIAYLTHSPDADAGAYVTALEAFASPELVSQLAPQFEPTAPSAAVQSAMVAGAVRMDDRHALVTVAATVAGRNVTRRVVTVPIARDGHGGLVVDDLPSFGSAATRAEATPPDVQPLPAREADAIEGVLKPFLRAYLAGDTAGLAYLVPPGTHIEATPGHVELIDLTSVSAMGPSTRAELVALATVDARDTQTRTPRLHGFSRERERRDSNPRPPA
jgi:hypothetical protein